MAAANFGLKFLEPDTLPLIALAVQHRLRGLVENMVAARDHRAGTSHLRPPPLYDRPDLVEAEIIAPMYDEVMYDDVEKVLATYDAVDRAEERRARIERSQREQAEKQEQIEREAAETAAKELAAEAAAEAAGGKKGKKKAMNATQAAKNVTEQQMHDLSMRTAARQLGGPALPAWAMGHVGPSTSSKPASALPTPAAAPGTPSTSMAAQQETYVPLSASIDRARMPLDSLDSFISWRDAVYALERERGVGSVGGSGSKVLHTTLAKRSTRRPP